MIILVSGSTRKDSINRAFIQLLSKRLGEKEHVVLDLRSYPMFDPNVDTSLVAKEIQDLRKQIKESDALIIATPEYLHNIPAVLKSFLEWLNGLPNLHMMKAFPMVVTPVAPRGQKALLALTNSLLALGFQISPSMLIHHQSLKFSIESDELISFSEDLEEQLFELLNLYPID